MRRLVLSGDEMTGTVAGAISDEPVLASNALAEVTPNFIVINNPERQSYTILPISRLTAIELIQKPYPGLLVIASGLFVLAAGASCSKEGDGAAIPMGLLGVFLLILYFASRRGSVTFLLTSGAAETVTGGVREAADLVALVESARRSRPGEVAAQLSGPQLR